MRKKPNIFICYSRLDGDFAIEIADSLESNGGCNVFIDRLKLHEGEPFKEGLKKGIAYADVIIFIASPDSIVSDYCKWELKEAEKLCKRIIPVLARPLDGATLPKQAAAINCVCFVESDGRPRYGALDKLRQAIFTDLDWLREHRRLLVHAQDWESAGRAPERALPACDIALAKKWLEQAPRNGPGYTQLHREFIEASERVHALRRSEERKQLRKLQIISGLAVLCAAAASGAVWQGLQKPSVPVLSQPSAHEWRAVREAAGGEIRDERAEQFIAQSHYLSDQANQYAGREDYATAMLAALAAFPDAGPDGAASRSYVADVLRSLEAAYHHNREQNILQAHGGRVTAAAFSPDGKRVVTASSDGTVRIWDVAAGKAIILLAGHKDRVHHAEFSPDGRRVVTASSDKTVRIWDAGAGKTIAVLRGHERAVWSAAFSLDGKRVVTASSDRTARIWDVAAGEVIISLTGHKDEVHHAAFSPDGRRVVTASSDHVAGLWDAETGEVIASLSHKDEVHHAAFSPSGGRVVTASADHAARLWDAETGKAVAVLQGHKQVVRSAAFSSDGTLIVTASEDNTARLWEAAGGQAIAVFSGHEGAVNWAAFSRDGARVVTASSDKTARLWNTSGTMLYSTASAPDNEPPQAFIDRAQRLIERARRLVPRCWTPEQLKKFRLLPEPPRWCVTGPGLEQEKTPAKWRPKWPYHTPAWRKWLAARDRGETPPLPAARGPAR